MKEVFFVGNNKSKQGEITIVKLPDDFPVMDLELKKDDILFHSESKAEDLFILPVIALNITKSNIGIIVNPEDINED